MQHLRKQTNLKPAQNPKRCSTTCAVTTARRCALGTILPGSVLGLSSLPGAEGFAFADGVRKQTESCKGRAGSWKAFRSWERICLPAPHTGKGHGSWRQRMLGSPAVTYPQLHSNATDQGNTKRTPSPLNTESTEFSVIGPIQHMQASLLRVFSNTVMQPWNFKVLFKKKEPLNVSGIKQQNLNLSIRRHLWIVFLEIIVEFDNALLLYKVSASLATI